MAPACSPELLHRASRIARLLDEEGDAVLPVHCWRTLLRELDVPEDSEAANFLMDYVEPCSQGHFTFEPLLAAAARFDGGADYGPDYGPEDGDAGYGYADAGYGHADAGYGHAGDVTTDHQAAPRVPALDLGKAQRAQDGTSAFRVGVPQQPGCDQDRPGAGPNSGGKANGYPTNGAEYAIPSRLNEAELREHEASQLRQHLEVVDEAFWQRRGPAIQHLYSQWDCNQLTNQSFQAQMQNVLGPSVDIGHLESEFLRLINKHLSARTMKFASMMAGLRRDAQSTARRGGLISYAGSCYEPSEAGSEASSAAGKPTSSAMRGGRRHFQKQAENHVLPPKLGQLPENDVRDFPEEALPTSAKPELQGRDNMDIFGRKIANPMPRRHHEDRSDAGSVISGAHSAFSEADSQREAFSYRNRNGHGNILAWDSARPVTPPKSRQGRHVAVDPDKGMPRMNMSSGIF
ncbi:unnamed protein product [Effrenium voratum]|uniref:Uncharacterized protein n=1 Tax=Effrenium voratum TaxID=2562239 RepID=A0AA36MTI3_9DINO|nr:unnamed protein product [Effrenium voratum]